MKDVPPVERTIFSNVSDENWNDYKWQLRNSLTKYEQLNTYGIKFDEEVKKLNLPLRVTPYYIEVCNKGDKKLLKTIIPSILETQKSEYESFDPLLEEDVRKNKCIVHRYPDRVLFLVTNSCSNNCRFCTRSRIIDKHEDVITKSDYIEAFEYIKVNKISEIIISGGDPLMLSLETLKFILTELKSISTVEIIRIGTKIPTVMPMRITKELCDVLKLFHPLYMSIHFTHQNELTLNVKNACEMLVNSGIVLRSQTVILKDVNNSVDELKNLFKGLLKFRVSPYYAYVCDYIIGSQHFRVSESECVELINSLRNNISGYAIPSLIRDSSNGKIPLY
jgi:lysine 2,3-aminomutase